MKNIIKIRRRINISKTRSEKGCVLCKGVLEKGDDALIIYLAHRTYNLYAWLHFSCIEKLKIWKPNNMYFEYGGNCSYCSSRNKLKGKLLKFERFLMHEQCIDDLMEHLKKYKEEITARCL